LGNLKERDHLEDPDEDKRIDNIELVHKEIGWGGVDWIHLA
jgi:hypothetical protein